MLFVCVRGQPLVVLFDMNNNNNNLPATDL